MLALATLPPEEYVRDVLPQTQALWAGRRGWEDYVAEFRADAASAWGRRRFRVVGLRLDGVLVASCKRYERGLRCGERSYRAAGIGAVFTPAELRGRGYASALLGALLDAERAAGTDLAYLFTNIHPAFYLRLGFAALPSRAISLRADALPAERVEVVPLGAADAGAVRRAFAALDARRTFALARTPLDWEWQRARAASGQHDGQPVHLGVRRGRGLAAYVLGRRVPAADAFVVDEFAFARDEDARCVGPLLRAAAGDLRKVQGWLPPGPARAALPRGAVRPRREGITMVVALSPALRAALRAAPSEEPCWATDEI